MTRFQIRIMFQIWVRFQMWSGSKLGQVPNWVMFKIGSGSKLGQVPLVTTNLHTKFEDRRPKGSLVIDRTRTNFSVFYLSGAITLEPLRGYGWFKKGTKILW